MSAPWQEEAACRNLDTALFYPARGHTEQEERARTVCATCPAREACLAAVLADEKHLRPSDRDGIRGGLNGRERYALQHGPDKPRRRKPRPAKPRALLPCGTPAAYDRHVRRGEPIDQACREGRRARWRSPRQASVAVTERPECGTRSGHQWHTAHNEIPCQPCAAADLAVTWFLRTTAA
ncbi:WhiB family transcriptional regulator [Streptomyces sp. NPDC018584]|uniref:WhiB family transcriptional regulator n=1 Tax=unclassified Streptomyces TaxID=2593676 RepID=UPI0037BB2F35